MSQKSEEPRWVRIAECSTGFEADLLRAELESAHIPVLIRGTQAGIFGSAYQGPVIGGVEVHVPSPELERAQEILETRLRPDAE